jgi:hypothetical protein
MTGIRRERRALRRDPKLVRVVAQMPIPAEECQRGDRINAARHDCDAVAIGGKQPIPLLQCANGSDLARLLAAGGRVDGQPPLFGQRGCLGVESAAEHHRAVEIQYHVVGRSAQPAPFDGRAVGGYQGQRFVAWERTG